MIGYNERAWAIDLISEINKWSSARDVLIKRASGESTLKGGGSTFFPDVVLFGDSYGGSILQGWELKFPDTNIDDTTFIENASKKARILGLNSFLLWNVRYAKLMKIGSNGEFICVKTWNKLSTIANRSEVKSHEREIFKLLQEILEGLLFFFKNGTINSIRSIDSISGQVVSQIILDNSSLVAWKIKEKAMKDYITRDSINKWWWATHMEYQKRVDDEVNMWNQRAIVVLISWVNKIIFSHILMRYYSDFECVDSDHFNLSPKNATEIFRKLTNKHDFWNILEPQDEELSVEGRPWESLVEFNKFLKGARINKLSIETITEMLSLIIEREKRKAAGQFTTPLELADFMVHIGIENAQFDFLDPCCGTGTIAKAAYTFKLEQDPSHASNTVWASDKFSLPVQMATLSLIRPNQMGELVRVFKQDVISLKQNMEVDFIDPYTGNNRKEKLPKIHYVVSNLPFVEQELVGKLNPEIYEINTFLCEIKKTGGGLSGKSDLYAYIVFYLWRLIEADGIITINISNSWLGAVWGEKFRDFLMRLFEIKYIITSGNGRWFREPKVVTTVLIIKKRENPVSDKIKMKKEKISFVVLSKKLSEYRSSGLLKLLSSLIRSGGDDRNENFSKLTYSISDIVDLSSLGLGWNAFFSQCDWITKISHKLVKASVFFNIHRGSRRGWDAMFYPSENNQVESTFMVPALKTSASIDTLICNPDSMAFCCTLSINELKEKGYSKAIEWIKRFESQNNGSGKPLSSVLKRKESEYWYSMSPNETADIVTSTNPGDRLFFARLKNSALVNQRLIRFETKDTKDLDLLHALLNSVLSLYYLEAIGFGRGMGALDINAENLKDRLRIFDPRLIKEDDKEDIKKAFEIIKGRKIKKITDEITSEDRLKFEEVVFKALDISEYRDRVISSLLYLHNLRKSVND